MRTVKQKAVLTLKIIIALIILVIMGLYSFRNTLLEQILAKTTSKAATEYDCNFTIKEAHFEGLSGLQFTDVVLAPKNADTLFKIQNMSTSVNLMQLFFSDLQLESLKIQKGYVQLTKKGDVKNFAAFIKRNDDEEESGNDKRDYAAFTYRIISKVLNLIPTDMKVENLTFRLDDNGMKASIDIKKLALVNKKIETFINVQTKTFTQNWKIKGLADPRNKTTDVRFFNLDSGAIKLPYVDERYNLITSFDSIRLKIQNISKDGDELHLDGYASIVNLKINHSKIANKDVVIKDARFDYRFLLGANFISIDSSSTVRLNKIKLNPYLSYNTEEDTIYKLKIAIPKMKTQDFITSLPDGLFTHFQGMEATGTFDYKLNFKFNKNKPNQLVFDSNVKKQNMRITKYGEANLNKINNEFVYRAIINNVLQRPVLVGLANQNYTPLDQISPYLQKSVLISEDPSFFTHRGFINEAFKQSIVKNIRTKKFSRGASTISMQLVKNVFLTREKTLSRKMEEILLVYLLENNRISTKERMLEVYFNIIEWGPNVYGIGEASQYYFQKKPIDLTLNECLYLARIIPSPNKFMYQFNTDGNLKETSKKAETFLINTLIKRGLLAIDDSIYKSQSVLITGPAKSLIRIISKDTLAIDSLKTPKLTPLSTTINKK
ncbi:transglycosylase domain-containing protein [Flavobacterium algicola]|uniref:transglycosylase domain-containing protein n=1 Tax=Flavobacterium algicola TaxID=556529 RepID=UPI001EFE06DF|nr:biosynthetic peptidoglycan transglycosylase [Flavobacterium algicola]MCG9791771.1 transglycosylase domain-containing protein [Flavobacterium algicola]